jgi:hypothetical protein
MISPPPSKRNIVDAMAKFTDAFWLEFFSAVYKGIKYTQTSGTTAQRPTKDLFNFRFYGDETLGIPIWYFNGIWIDAQGNPV